MSRIRGAITIHHARVDRAYRALIDHTSTCPACRTGTDCPAVASLRAAWRAAKNTT